MARARRLCRAATSVAMLALVVGVASAAEPAAGPGDAARGRALFTGATAMQNGGAACGACHAVGGHGGLLAASFGPELSQSFEGMAAEAVDGMLQDLPFPTMAPIYTGHPLTPQERADLAQFLVGVSGAPPPGGNAIAGTATAIGAVLLVLMAGRARRRKRPTRGTLVARPPSPARAPSTGRPISPAVASPPPVRSAHGGSR